MPGLGPFTAFAGQTRLAAGDLITVGLAIRDAIDAGKAHLVVFEDATGEIVEIDTRGSADEIRARLSAQDRNSPPQPSTPARGRPRLGVVAREVTLLPRHWDWLARQPGGSSQALRRLVDQARQVGSGREGLLDARQALARVMSVLGGDLENYEEAMRALYAGEHVGLSQWIAHWPEDIRAYVLRLIAVLDQHRMATTTPSA